MSNDRTAMKRLEGVIPVIEDWHTELLYEVSTKFKSGHFISLNFAAMVMLIITMYRISGIIHRRKVSRITFFAIVHEKTFAIQANLYIKIPVKIKSARKYSRMLPDSQNSQTFSSVDDSQYMVYERSNLKCKPATPLI